MRICFMTTMNNYFEDISNNLKYVVVYDRIRHDCGYREVLSYGFPKREYYDNGMVSDEQMDYFKTIEEAEDRYSVLSQITNREYKNIRIIKRN